MKVDLHCHTTASDGQLSPLQLLSRAQQQGVQLLAITDHDTIQGYLDLLSVQKNRSIQLISGVEFSAVWSGVTIHVVGLNINVESAELQHALARQNEARVRRAAIIGARLDQRGCTGALAGAQQIAGTAQIGRPHFARYMVATGFVASQSQAFDKYLGSGKPGDVKAQWPEIAEVVTWIKRSGGISVLAHPGKYPMTNTKLKRLISAFTACGGDALEVVSGMQNQDKTRHFAGLAAEYDLAASQGSDFHGPPSQWSDIGRMSSLPQGCRSVVELLGL